MHPLEWNASTGIQEYANNVLAALTTNARGVDGCSCLTGTSSLLVVDESFARSSFEFPAIFDRDSAINALTSNSTISCIDYNVAAHIQHVLNDYQESGGCREPIDHMRLLWRINHIMNPDREWIQAMSSPERNVLPLQLLSSIESRLLCVLQSAHQQRNGHDDSAAANHGVGSGGGSMLLRDILDQLDRVNGDLKAEEKIMPPTLLSLLRFALSPTRCGLNVRNVLWHGFVLMDELLLHRRHRGQHDASASSCHREFNITSFACITTLYRLVHSPLVRVHASSSSPSGSSSRSSSATALMMMHQLFPSHVVRRLLTNETLRRLLSVTMMMPETFRRLLLRSPFVRDLVYPLWCPPMPMPLLLSIMMLIILTMIVCDCFTGFWSLCQCWSTHCDGSSASAMTCP